MKVAVVYFDFELRDRCVGSTRTSKSKSPFPRKGQVTRKKAHCKYHSGMVGHCTNLRMDLRKHIRRKLTFLPERCQRQRRGSRNPSEVPKPQLALSWLGG
ncbi:hypothetical protein LOK49_LG15G01083 [Camellia lanceoleosa]|uniref:Uncharacterized protein n=1 Tax=Camellia lanceoleosa TaxID=1840588 RepID=A0ACC0F6G3_9ERIC|nr:hypothetical protein LOK49_LG15G01083 [Camellia lanceoleosa]